MPLALNVLTVFDFSHDGTDSPPDASEVVIVINSFKSKIIKVKVSSKGLCKLAFLERFVL